MEHHTSSSPSKQQQACQDLFSLPPSVLVEISMRCNEEIGHPMLGVSRGGRDTVLSNLKKIRLCNSPAGAAGGHDTANESEALGGLLHRACSQAPVGLEVGIDLSGSIMQTTYFPKLLQPGIRCGGWRHVHSLEVRVHCQEVSHAVFQLANQLP
jgi:hypothetical protein